MDKILIFAGTYEGRRLCEFLVSKGLRPTVSVATDYGKVMLDDIEGLDVRTGRLDVEAMAELIKGYDVIIDATHPYAEIVSKNLREGSEIAGVKYLRLVREESEFDDVISVSSVEEAVLKLNTMEGNILLTTGSKELHKYKSVENFTNRVFARVLPSSEVLTMCEELGLKGRNVIAMQGPFSQELNTAILKEYNCSILVTKSTGDVGGFSEKIQSAKDGGARVIVIRRPVEEKGLSLRGIMDIFGGEEDIEVENKLDIKIEEPLSKNRDERYRYFPLFVDTNGMKVLVVGCGNIGKRRIRKLREFGFDITVVAPIIAEKLSGINYLEREFEVNDVKGATLVVVATENREVNKTVANLVKAEGNWCSVADRKDEGNFIFPGILLENDIVVALSSDGKSPSKTKILRESLRLFLREEYLSEN